MGMDNLTIVLSGNSKWAGRWLTMLHLCTKKCRAILPKASYEKQHTH